MKNFKKILISSIFIFGMLLVTNSVYASDNLPSEGQIKVNVTNNQSGETETTILHPKDSQINTLLSKGQSIKKGYEVFIPIEYENTTNSNISPFVVDGSVEISGGVKAQLFVDYDWRASKGEVRLNRLYGSWTPDSNMYGVFERKASAHSGVPYGSKISRNPSANSFSYNTGFGWNYTTSSGDFAPRAWSSAEIRISGMTATHTIELEFTYP